MLADKLNNKRKVVKKITPIVITFSQDSNDNKIRKHIDNSNETKLEAFIHTDINNLNNNSYINL